MADSPIFPGNSTSPLTQDGQWRGEWFRYFRDLAKQPRITTDQSAAILALAERVVALEEGEEGSAIIQGLHSVRVLGSLSSGAVTLQLVNDEAAPEASSYYGTNDTGAKGFHALPEAPPQLFNRITNDGDARIDGDGNLRVTY